MLLYMRPGGVFLHACNAYKEAEKQHKRKKVAIFLSSAGIYVNLGNGTKHLKVSKQCNNKALGELFIHWS